MMFTQKKRLVMAVAGVVSLGTTTVHAVDFNATTTLQNTLSVTVVQDFDIGTVFATSTGFASAGGTLYDDGVGGFVIDPVDGSTDALATTSATVTLTSISTPTPAQGSVDTIGDFSLQLPDTVAIDEADFIADAGGSLADLLTDAVELVHESGNTAVPSLYMMHFTMEGVSDGTISAPAGSTTNDGAFAVTPGFGVTTYIFNIGATVTTQPHIDTVTNEGLAYQEGIYSGTFEVTASY